MNILVCDVCRRCIIGNDPRKDATMHFEDLFSSRTFICFNPTEDIPRKEAEMTLCTECKTDMFYYMKNKKALSNDIQSMSLINRVRFLLKKPLIIKEADDGKENEN